MKISRGKVLKLSTCQWSRLQRMISYKLGVPDDISLCSCTLFNQVQMLHVQQLNDINIAELKIGVHIPQGIYVNHKHVQLTVNHTHTL